MEYHNITRFQQYSFTPSVAQHTTGGFAAATENKAHGIDGELRESRALPWETDVKMRVLQSICRARDRYVPYMISAPSRGIATHTEDPPGTSICGLLGGVFGAPRRGRGSDVIATWSALGVTKLEKEKEEEDDAESGQ